jgi:hypothetical protein
MPTIRVASVWDLALGFGIAFCLMLSAIAFSGWDERGASAWIEVSAI